MPASFRSGVYGSGRRSEGVSMDRHCNWGQVRNEWVFTDEEEGRRAFISIMSTHTLRENRKG